MLLLATLALAGPADTLFPRAATVDLPADGVVLIEVPGALRSPADPDDGSDLLLVDAAGEPVDFAVLTDTDPPTWVRARKGLPTTPGPLVWWPGEDRDTYWVSVDERPLDALSIRLPWSAWSAMVVVEEQTEAGLVERARQRVWRLDDLDDQAVPLPDRLGTYRVTVAVTHPERVRGEAELVGVRYDSPPLPPSTWTLEVRGRLQDNGVARYDLPLSHPQPIDWVQPLTDADLFQLPADVVGLPSYADTPTTLAPELTPRDPHTIRRVNLGGATVDDTRVPVSRQDLDHPGPLALVLDTRTRDPLDVRAVQVGVHPKVLVVRDAGPGPHTLLGGADAGDGATLQFAARELWRTADTTVVADDVRPNPAFVPLEVRSQVAGPGRSIDLAGLSFRRPLSGDGLVRVALDAHVLTKARSDLGDLRVVDQEGRQLPYLLRRSVATEGALDLPMRREEADAHSEITVELPESNLFVSTVSLHTSAPVFQRTVTIAQPRPGRPAEPLRVTHWDGTLRPGTLGVGVHRRVGDELLVTVDNGDDPPLPIDRVDVTWEGWDLLVMLPEGGEAHLYYGDPDRRAPSYDFASLDALAGRAVPAAEVGAPEDAKPPGPGWIERLLVFAGLAVLAVGLLVLTVLLIRGAPPEADAPEGEE